MDNKQTREFNETINHIFKMDEKEVFSNEIKSLLEEIEKNKLQSSKVLILINFIQYKLNELDSHHQLAKEMLKTKEYNTENLLLLNIFSKYSDDQYFINVKKFMIEVLVEKLLLIQNFSIDQVKTSLTKINSKCQESNGENLFKEESVIKYIESKIDEKKNSSKDNFESLILTADDLLVNTVNQKTNFDNIVNSNDNSNLNEYIYDLKIYYSGGADSCSQNCSIKFSNPVNLETFIFYLKKRLGIYEHAKFNILILNKDKQEVEYLHNISQLSLKDINEIKIVPDE